MKPIGYYVFASLLTVLIIFSSITFAGEQEKTNQVTHGDQSPAIVAKGDVSIIYKGLPKEERELLYKERVTSQKLIERLLKELEAKDIELENKDATIQAWAKKYEELSKKIYQMPGDSDKSSKAKAALIEGDLKKAESIVTMRGVSGSGISIH